MSNIPNCVLSVIDFPNPILYVITNYASKCLLLLYDFFYFRFMVHYIYYSLSLIRFLFALLQFRFVRSLTNRASLRRPWINVFIKCQFRGNLSHSLHTMIITIRIYVSFSSETYVINAFFPQPLLFQFIREIFLNTCSKI